MLETHILKPFQNIFLTYGIQQKLPRFTKKIVIVHIFDQILNYTYTYIVC